MGVRITMKLIDRLVQSYTKYDRPVKENSMAARRAAAKRVHHSELVKDMDQSALIDYLMKNPKFAKSAAKAKVDRSDIYFDDNELVFGDKTVARFSRNDKVSDLMQKVK